MYAVERSDCLIVQLLQPFLVSFDSFDGAYRVCLQQLLCVADSCAGGNALGSRFHFAFDSMQLFPAPSVRIRKIEGGAEK